MESTSMPQQKINRLSGIVLIALSLVALCCVVSGFFHPPQPDEGAAAHIFQLSVVALLPAILLFLLTADWKQPLQNARLLGAAGATLVIAFGALYWLEHYR